MIVSQTTLYLVVFCSETTNFTDMLMEFQRGMGNCLFNESERNPVHYVLNLVQEIKKGRGSSIRVYLFIYLVFGTKLTTEQSRFIHERVKWVRLPKQHQSILTHLLRHLLIMPSSTKRGYIALLMSVGSSVCR